MEQKDIIDIITFYKYSELLVVIDYNVLKKIKIKYVYIYIKKVTYIFVYT